MLVLNNEATITKCKDTVSGSIVIPNTLGGYPVTALDDYAFNECISLAGVTIGDNITTIG